MAREGFNANTRAAEREAGPVTLGDKTYHPARLTNARMRQVRALSRQGTAEARRILTDTDEYKAAYEEAIADGETEEEAKKIARDAGEGSELIAAINDESLSKQLSIMLVGEDQQPVPEEVILKHLNEDVDARDIEGLMSYVLATEDPTSPSTTPTSTTTT